MDKQGRILLVEDDEEVGKLVTMALSTHGFQHEWAKNGAQTKTWIQRFTPQVILLDLGLPDIDGLEIIKQVRTQQVTPIIVISARSEEQDKIKALDLGADDYLVKPFSVAELLARIRVALRRNAYLDQVKVNRQTYTNGPLTIDFVTRTVTLNQRVIHLTKLEYALLTTFADNNDKVLTHHYLLEHIWGIGSTEDTSSLRVAVATLRRKLEPQHTSEKFIQTYVGVGYRLIQHAKIQVEP